MNANQYSLAKATMQKDKLLNNIQAFRNGMNADTAFMAVIKANAYSHGAVPLAQVMETADAVDYFGVAQLQEALELRAANIQTPILIFNAVRLEEVDLAIQNELTMTVFSKELAKKIAERAKKLNTKALVHLKMDTGMARIGVSSFKEALEIYKILDNHFVDIEGIYTHFADATDTGPDNFTDKQFMQFHKILDQFAVYNIDFGLTHVCNTAATINFPAYHLDMVRVGIGLYGFNPTADDEMQLALAPIQQLDAVVTHVKDLPAGESVGYNRTYFSEKPLRIATIALGYADGVPRALSNKAAFTYNGIELPIIGLICMDQIMLDCSAVPTLAVGNSVNYFGDPNEGYTSIVTHAKTADSSEYELLCRIGNRVERAYE